ncbi:MAG: outer membrane beta-barrel protein [Planctomycetaceae bacterium]|nr:outer membrane beta-barrel protein [Planctomycetaceae bacterium]
MRLHFFSQFFFLVGIFFLFCVGEQLVLAQNDPFLSPEKVPFPFAQNSDQETTTSEKDIPADQTPTVPIPPDTFANHDEGYVPNIYYRIAPDPPLILRPRYRSNSAGNSAHSAANTNNTIAEKQSGKSQKSNQSNKIANQSKKGDKPDKTNHSDEFNQSDANDSLSPIRQVSASDAPAPPTESIAESTTESNVDFRVSPIATAASLLKYPISLTPQKKKFSKNSDSTASQQEYPHNPYTVNNAHSCDDLSCGESGCSSHSLSGIFQHLSEQTVKRGVCHCCGFSRCINKTVGAWYYDGWLNVGAFMNTHYPENRHNTPLYYNDRNAEMVVNQLYFTLGRRIDLRGGRFDFGGRIDFLYGTDYFYTSSLGLETHRYNYIFADQPTLEPLEANLHWNSNSGTRRLGTVSLYGLSLPQAYAEMFIPFGNGITVKAGHFYSGMGLESAMSPNNFFYSHSYSFMYGSPTTLTGITATAKLSSRFSAMLGFSRGWNIFEKSNDKLSGLAGLAWQSFDKRTALSFLVHSGEESFRNGDNRTNYALTWQHQLSPHWHYALEHTFGYEKNGAALNLLDGTRGTARWYSFAQYLQWKWSERFALGLRGEWFRDNGQARIQKDFVDSSYFRLEGNDYFQITLGANWKPTRYMTIRPEIRYDWSNVVVTDAATGNQTGIYSNNKKQMLSFALDGIFRF